MSMFQKKERVKCKTSGKESSEKGFADVFKDTLQENPSGTPENNQVVKC